MGFRSADELRQILDEVLREIDADPEDGPCLRAVAGPLRLEVTDLKLALNLAPSEEAKHFVRWNFARRPKPPPRLRLVMDAEFANRFLQGRENPVIAIARGSLRTKVSDAGVALRFFPAARPIFTRYRELVVDRYPHLSLD